MFLADQPAEEEEDCEDDLKMESAKSESETEKSETEKMEESTEENQDSDSNKATMEDSSGESPEPDSETGGKETMEEENGNSGNGNSSISRENMDDNGDTEEKDSEETENTVRRLKPRTSSLDTIVLSYNSLNSLPESQYEGNSNLTQLFQPITIQSNSVGQYQNHFQEVGQDSRPNRDSKVNPGLKQTNKEVNSEQCCVCLKYLLKVGISVALACCQSVVRKLDQAQAKVGCL